MSTVAIYEGPTRVGEVDRGRPEYLRVEFAISGETTWATNGVVYRTREEAEQAASAKAMAWTMVRDWRVVTDDTPLKQRTADTGPGAWG